MKDKPSISILGLGRVGRALYVSLKREGYKIHSVYSRNSKDVPEYKGAFPPDLSQTGELFFITVSDDQIKPVISDLKDLGGHSTAAFVHCSGTFTSSIFEGLSPLAASFHPMKAVTDSTDTFHTSWFDAEGAEAVLRILQSLSNDLGIHMLRVSPEAKPFLHAASVMASNYMVSLASLSRDMAEAGGIEPHQAFNALLPLMKSSLQNIEDKGIDHALTGPIDRGDIMVVREHLEVLKHHPDLLSAYKTLGLASIKLSKSKDQKSLAAIKELFE